MLGNYAAETVSQPAALGGNQHGLGAVHRAELAVDVVQVGPDGARGEGQLVRDLLVDLALGQPLEHAELPARERASVDVALALDEVVGKFVHHPAKLLGAEANRACGLQELGRADPAALLVVGEHAGAAAERALAPGAGTAVALAPPGHPAPPAPPP